ncbi:MAG: hypothetical protein WKF70_00980 [Chitinophagaceae bacterium]
MRIAYSCAAFLFMISCISLPALADGGIHAGKSPHACPVNHGFVKGSHTNCRVNKNQNVPFDGGLSLLLGAGAICVVRRARDKRLESRLVLENVD